MDANSPKIDVAAPAPPVADTPDVDQHRDTDPDDMEEEQEMSGVISPPKGSNFGGNDASLGKTGRDGRPPIRTVEHNVPERTKPDDSGDYGYTGYLLVLVLFGGLVFAFLRRKRVSSCILHYFKIYGCDFFCYVLFSEHLCIKWLIDLSFYRSID